MLQLVGGGGDTVEQCVCRCFSPWFGLLCVIVSFEYNVDFGCSQILEVGLSLRNSLVKISLDDGYRRG